MSELKSFPNETEWLEFKIKNAQEIGEYISALSNAVCIHDKEYGYVVFGACAKAIATLWLQLLANLPSSVRNHTIINYPSNSMPLDKLWDRSKRIIVKSLDFARPFHLSSKTLQVK